MLALPQAGLALVVGHLCIQEKLSLFRASHAIKRPALSHVKKVVRTTAEEARLHVVAPLLEVPAGPYCFKKLALYVEEWARLKFPRIVGCRS